jgi:hypothetical protein
MGLERCEAVLEEVEHRGESVRSDFGAFCSCSPFPRNGSSWTSLPCGNSLAAARTITFSSWHAGTPQESPVRGWIFRHHRGGGRTGGGDVSRLSRDVGVEGAGVEPPPRNRPDPPSSRCPLRSENQPVMPSLERIGKRLSFPQLAGPFTPASRAHDREDDGGQSELHEKGQESPASGRQADHPLG